MSAAADGRIHRFPRICSFHRRRAALAGAADPGRARAGPAAGVLAAFAASGAMHEAMVCYPSLRWPPSGGMTRRVAARMGSVGAYATT